MSRRYRILFAISDTGGGHRSGAAALHAALLRHPHAQGLEYNTIDMITSTGLPLLRNAPGLYDDLSTRWLPLFNLLFQLTNGRRRIDTISQIAYVSAQRNIYRTIESYKPDLIVSVHPLANRFIGHARRTYNMPFRFITVVTDLVSLHTAWGDLDADLCIAPTHEAVDLLIKQGMPAENVVYAGFPVHPKFTACTLTADEARAQTGLDKARYTLLVTAGGVGSGRLRELVVALHNTHPDAQLLVVTGRNAQLRAELQRLALPAHVHIYGFVDNMEQLMAASDVVVTKAGPGTLMEALVMRRPVIITEAVGIQERGNIDFVLQRGLGEYSKRIPDIVAAVTKLADPVVRADMVARLGDAVPRDGAQRIADIILEQLALDPPVMHKHPLILAALPHWLRRQQVGDEGRKRLRILNAQVIDSLRRYGGLSVNWPRRSQRRVRKNTPDRN
ncbi:MAG: MGDG synthase family glycosyltransferase [Roseiflexaceae bacterium]